MRYFIKPNQWLVYHHAAIAPGATHPDVFWIGACLLADFPNDPIASRRADWHRAHEVAAINGDAVACYLDAIHDNAEAALAHVASLTAGIDAERTGTRWIGDAFEAEALASHRFGTRSAGSPIVETTTGRHFENIAQAAQMLGINRVSISRHLDGKSGYKHVQGYKFKRTSDNA